MASSNDSFKEKLKSLFSYRLNNIFDQDNICTSKLIWLKCCCSSVYTVFFVNLSVNLCFFVFVLEKVLI